MPTNNAGNLIASINAKIAKLNLTNVQRYRLQDFVRKHRMSLEKQQAFLSQLIDNPNTYLTFEGILLNTLKLIKIKNGDRHTIKNSNESLVSNIFQQRALQQSLDQTLAS